MKESSCIDPRIASYYQEVCKLESKFDGLEVNHIPCRFNETADALAKAASSCKPAPAGVFASDQMKPMIHIKEAKDVDQSQPKARPKEEGKPPSADVAGKVIRAMDEAVDVADEAIDVMDVEEGKAPNLDWRRPYLNCLTRCILPVDATKAKRLTRRTKSFVLVKGELYKQSATRVLQCYIPTK
jgi:hypothetical protein